MTIRLAILAVAATLVLAPTAAGAFGFSSSSSDKKADSAASASFAAGKKAADGGDFATAVKHLTKAVEADPSDADGFNLLGFSYRKLGDVETAFAHYKSALKLNRNYRGANEYIGELYLGTGNLAMPEKHLTALGKVCAYSCPEYKELKTAVKAYKVARGS